jgi:hypothetical protein
VNSQINDERMNEILATHLINSDFLLNNDFESFYEQRSNELIKRIEKVMGKIITTSVTVEEYQEEPDEVINELAETEIA